MTAIAPRPLVSVADYLAGEESAECRHEFLDGEVKWLGLPEQISPKEQWMQGSWVKMRGSVYSLIVNLLSLGRDRKFTQTVVKVKPW